MSKKSYGYIFGSVALLVVVIALGVFLSSKANRTISQSAIEQTSIYGASFDKVIVPNIVFQKSDDNTAKNIAIDKSFSFTMKDMKKSDNLESVKVTGKRNGKFGKVESKNVKLSGTVNKEKSTWKTNNLLEPSTTYTVKATLNTGVVLTGTFTTKKVALSNQIYPSLFPVKGTFGQGQVVVVKFDKAVANKKSIEKKLHVKASSKQKGSWHWISDTQVRYRPKTYWKPGTTVKVNANINSISAGKGIYGQVNTSAKFKISKTKRKVIANLQTHQARIYKNGKHIKTMPFSAGEPRHVTRSGTKLVMSKHRYVDMNSSSIGIDPGSSDGYDLSDVEYAIRVTNSGEFIHAAPWNAGLFGRVNASHGCTGFSTDNARWLYNFVQVGDPIKFTGSSKQMTVENGYGDWAISWKKYKAGSALN